MMSAEPLDQSAKVPRVTLSDNVSMPWLGFGTSNITPEEVKQSASNVGDLYAGEPAYESIKFAVKCGYRFFDTAALYGNEHIVGQALNDAINEGLVTRDELFVCTKVWCTAHKRRSVMLACKESLSKLQMDYIDLYLIHWPVAYLDRFEPPPAQHSSAPASSSCCNPTAAAAKPTQVAADNCPRDYSLIKDRLINPKDPRTNKLIYTDTHYTETWLGMQDVRDAGLVRSIGVSNFNRKMCQDILQMDGLKYAPTVNQVELHPYLSNDQLASFSRANNILLNAYCPLGAPGASWLPPNQPDVIRDPLIEQLAVKYQKTPAQIILRYHLDRAISPIPKSVTPARIAENISVFDFELEAGDLVAMLALNKNMRYCTNTAGEFVDDHPLYPFNEE